MLQYIQSTGELFRDWNHVAFGYSGKNAGKNNPEFESNGSNDTDEIWGPIPVGGYTIGPAFTSPHTGVIAMRLTPDPTNEMHHRGDFEIHGDSALHPGGASKGCIIMPHDVRVAISRSPDKRLQVFARPVQTGSFSS